MKDKPVTTQTQHNHVYGPYESNEKGHWAECVDCGEKEAVQAHEYIGNGNICKICGYKRAAAAPQDGAKALPKTGDDTPLAALYALLAAALGAAWRLAFAAGAACKPNQKPTPAPEGPPGTPPARPLIFAACCLSFFGRNLDIGAESMVL